MTHARDEAAKEYLKNDTFQTKGPCLIAREGSQMPNCHENDFCACEMKDAFQAGAKWAIAHDPVVVQMLANYRFILGCAENLLRPDKPVHKGLDPTFYHTLTYEGDVELIEKCKQAREALTAYEKEVGDGT